MRRHLVVLATALAVVGIAACSRDKNDRPDPQAQAPVSATNLPGSVPATSNTPSSGGDSKTSGSKSSGSPTDPAGAKGHPQSLPTGTEINATGIGPYTIGQEQAVLASGKLVGPVRNGATGCDSGTGVAKWGSPALLFTKGKLQHVKITSTAVKTTAGVKVGSSEASVKAAYPKGSVTGGTAWYAPTGDFALLFRLAGGKVTAVEVGPASILETGSPNC